MATTVLNIPLTNGVYKNVDGTALTDHDAVLIDCYIDEMGFCNKRPGVSVMHDFTGSETAPVAGCYWWENKSLGVVVIGGRIGYVRDVSGTFAGGITSPSLLATNIPVTFATDGNYLYAANGGKIVYYDGTNSPAEITAANSPDNVTHIAWLDTYLLAAGDGTNKFYWSDPNETTSLPVWNALNFASASGNADPITAMKVFQREIFLFGASSFEVWQNQGESDAPFLRVPGGYYDVGCVAPYSIVMHGQEIYWLSDKRRIVRFSNGSLQNVSTQYDKDIAGYAGVTGCVGFSIVVDGRVFLGFNFTDVNKTLLYDIAQEKWHEWGYWDATNGERSRWIGQCVAWSPRWGINMVGSRFSSILYNAVDSANSDDGNVIRMQRVTGNIDYGTKRFKRSESINLRAKRGLGLPDRTPKMLIRWKNDGGNWSNYRELSLGNIGENDILLSIERTGIYKTRQYEIVSTDNVPVVIGRADEKVTILSR